MAINPHREVFCQSTVILIGKAGPGGSWIADALSIIVLLVSFMSVK
jgi:hypothetical protein